MTIKKQTTQSGDDSDTPRPRLISWKEVSKLIPLSRTTVWRMTRDGMFPLPAEISPGRKAWLEEEVLDWIKRRKST